MNWDWKKLSAWKEDTAVLDASNTGSSLPQGLKNANRPIACLESRTRVRLSQPGACSFCPHGTCVFCPIDRTGVVTQGNAGIERKKPTVRLPNPIRTTHPSRPLRGLASGTCYQVFPTNSRDYQTYFKRDQTAEIFLIRWKQGSITAL